MQSNFYYGNFEKHNGHSHFDLPSYSEYLNHCNNSQHLQGGAQTATDTVDDTACVPSVYIRYICHISLSSISPVPTLYPLVA